VEYFLQLPIVKKQGRAHASGNLQHDRNPDRVLRLLHGRCRKGVDKVRLLLVCKLQVTDVALIRRDVGHLSNASSLTSQTCSPIRVPTVMHNT